MNTLRYYSPVYIDRHTGRHTDTKSSVLFIYRSSDMLVLYSTGDLQSTVLAMRDCACEASVALMAYAGVSNRHSTLTSECGFMLEEV